MSHPNDIRVDLDGGKYTLVYDGATCEISALRHGQPWRSFPIGDKLLYEVVSSLMEWSLAKARDRRDLGHRERCPANATTWKTADGRPSCLCGAEP